LRAKVFADLGFVALVQGVRALGAQLDLPSEPLQVGVEEVGGRRVRDGPISGGAGGVAQAVEL